MRFLALALALIGLLQPAHGQNAVVLQEKPDPCGAGYFWRTGDLQDIAGWGSVNGKGGGVIVSKCTDCAALCDTESECMSYECSPTELTCNLNRERDPTRHKSRDCHFCSKGESSYGYYAGVYIRSDYSINGKPVYIDEFHNLFIGWFGSGWSLTSTQYLDMVLETQGVFGGFIFSYHDDIASGWKDYDATTVNNAEIWMTLDKHFSYGYNSKVDDYTFIVNGQWQFGFRLSGRVLNGRPEYFHHRENRRMVWSGDTHWRVTRQQHISERTCGDCEHEFATVQISSWEDSTNRWEGLTNWIFHLAEARNPGLGHPTGIWNSL